MCVEKRVEVYPHSAEYRRARKKQCPISMSYQLPDSGLTDQPLVFVVVWRGVPRIAA
jgi:hypothetical protein